MTSTMMATSFQKRQRIFKVITAPTSFTPTARRARLSPVIPFWTVLLSLAGQAKGSFPNDQGGGFFCDGRGSGNECSPTLTSLSFSGNSANYGGAISNFAAFAGLSSPILSNSIFYGNSAGENGGAIYNYGFSGIASPTLTNVSFSGNSATRGGAFYNYGSAGTSNAALRNIIMWGNTASIGAQIRNLDANVTIRYSLVEGGIHGAGVVSGGSGSVIDGGGNIDGDPLFIDIAKGNLRLGGNSPAIDAGDNSAVSLSIDLAGNPRFYDDTLVTDTGAGSPPIVDMGAYERQIDSASNLVIRKAATPTVTQPGATITYTLTFSNAGPDIATGVIITDSFPTTVINTSVTNDGVAITQTNGYPTYIWQVGRSDSWPRRSDYDYGTSEQYPGDGSLH